jgi:hypothetical protein
MSKHKLFIRWVCSIALGLAALLFLYVASYGPANSLVARGYLNSRRVDAVYKPLPDPLVELVVHYWIKVDNHPGVFARD